MNMSLNEKKLTLNSASLRQEGDMNKVIRPIHYLGSKLRVLEAIVKQINTISEKQLKVLDLFSGSTVVSQALADSGHQVTSNDVMGYSQSFAIATLGIGRCLENDILEEVRATLFTEYKNNRFHSLFNEIIELESDCITNQNGLELLNLIESGPKIWSEQVRNQNLLIAYKNLKMLEGFTAFETPILVTSFYGGTYFGYKQATEIDNLRFTIEKCANAGTISPWAKKAVLTALLSAASLAAFTPGKHFAQYHKVTGKVDTKFHEKRILADRKINILDEFNKALKIIFSRKNDGNHVALNFSMEDLSQNLREESFDVIYADPPYTAQQYSRFYHIPEVINSYKVPKLQIVKGEVTSGVYGIDRFKSRFSSKKETPEAFKDLARLALSKNADLLLSYSGNINGNSGNGRMITLEELTSILGSFFQSVEVVQLDLLYRQFNSNALAVKDRGDREYMIHCKIC